MICKIITVWQSKKDSRHDGYSFFQVYIGALIPTSLTDQTNITNGNTVYDILC